MDSLSSGRAIQFIRPSQGPSALADARMSQARMSTATIYFIDGRVPAVMRAIRISSMLTCHPERLGTAALSNCIYLSCKHVMSCIIRTAVTVPFGRVVRRLRLLLTYNTSQLRATRVVVLQCSDQDTNVLHDHHPLTLIESSFVIDGQLQGD
jgi:hypothetical protein